MLRPLCGGPDDIPGTPASEPPRPGLPPWPWRRCWPPAAAKSPPMRRSPPAPTRSTSSNASFPTEQDLGQTSLLRLGFRNTGEKTVPTLTVTISLAARRGRDVLAAVRDPRPAARPGAGRPAGLGAGGDLPAPAGLLGAGRRLDLERQDLRLRTAEARPDDEGDLEAERGQSRRLHAAPTASPPASTGRPRPRPEVAPPGGTFVAEITTELPNTEVTDDGEVVEEVRRIAGERCG